ncbi:beta-glucosidase [Demequina sp. TTPB684]|uniref:GH1 family beta-glucosidase n=1 Tax=unclassified Demequina TaxID=2620311 RepID=UPI001CF12E42|nr:MULTISPECIES: GH1 family beta-glucosidase [unclassified Demequina]MCB2411760.1 beta-glucosidase [Demequina sp. TTPB684]UPU88650.1 GH1 family beta-glucosidase [Demequina sp. TMPB413]
MSSSEFPDDFFFGASTASYQIEGGAAEGGRLPSIWDTFAHAQGRTLNGDSGDVACDHFHRYAEDIKAMAEIGLTAYRFSMAWPRIQPTGDGDFNQEGFAFYHRILDELAKYNIEPLVTLYHWDLPQSLEDAGGWPERAIVDRFVEYAERTVAEFKDKVTYWTTFNEPWCTAFLGYSSGAHAPGRSEPAASLAAAHHLNLAHGLAYKAIKNVHPDAKVSIVLNSHLPRPWNVADPRDVAVAQKIDALANRIFIDPYTLGQYPEVLLESTSKLTDWSFVHEGDLDAIKGTIDVLGVNYYSSHMVRFNDSPHRLSGEDGHKTTVHSCWPGADDAEFMPLIGKRTTMGWNVDPSGFHAHLMRMHRDTGLPMIVTENGASWPDEVSEDGRIRDVDRYTYLHDHMGALLRAREEGADVRGYMAWSLMDNFEWAYGYSKRFGMLRVDYTTQERTWKDSAYWYQETIRNRAITPLDAVQSLVNTPPRAY